MHIKRLLEISKISWHGSEEELKKDLNRIIELLSSLPEPKNKEINYKKFAILAKDEENQQAKKEDIIKEDMFKI